MDFINKASVKITVKGVVQGVGFRYFIWREAERLGLTGYAKNLFNGDVEIFAEGRKKFLEELLRKAKSGPTGAYVTQTKVEWLDFQNKFDNFAVR
jgi:acylphosphatase